jgi:hypothetical protein
MMHRRRPSPLRGRLAAALLAAVGLAILLGVASAYLHPDLRKSIVSSGFGLC